MSEATHQLVHAFSSLPRQERYQVLLELLRISEDDAGRIEDEELVQAGTELFAMYDREEADPHEAETR